MGILGPPYCGIGATIRIGREILCLPYAGFFLSSPAWQGQFKAGSQFIEVGSEVLFVKVLLMTQSPPPPPPKPPWQNTINLWDI